MADAARLLELSGVSAGYGRLPVLFDIDFHVDSGELVALIGPNGAGKSTLMKTAIGTVRPSRGRVLIAGAHVTHEPPHRRVRRGIALSPEGRRIFANLSVEENLRSGAVGMPRSATDEPRQRIFELFPLLEARLTQKAGSLSGGEQQMLAVGRALMSAPKVLLIDELSLGLAPLVVAELFVTLRRLAEEGLGVVAVDERAGAVLDVADRVYVLEQGALVFEGDHDGARNVLAAATALAGSLDRT
jgi:branched-chain amino acid transport system ATP-binding protein